MKKECPNYLKAKVKSLLQPLVTRIVPTIAPVDSSEDLSNLVEELGEHTEVESMGVGDESNDEEEELQLLS